jgi:hypothetical protein
VRIKPLVLTAAFATIAACADSTMAPPALLDSETAPALPNLFQAASATAPINPAELLAIGIPDEGRTRTSARVSYIGRNASQLYEFNLVGREWQTRTDARIEGGSAEHPAA